MRNRSVSFGLTGPICALLHLAVVAIGYAGAEWMKANSRQVTLTVMEDRQGTP